MPNFVGRVATSLSLVVLVGCNDLTGPNSLAVARRVWDAQNHTSYQYVGTRSCNCLGPFGPVNVTVVNNEVVSVIDLFGASHPTAGWLTIDGIFDEAESALAGDRLIDIDFDDDAGYPTRVEICCQEVDSGITRVITRVNPIPGILARS